MLTQRTQTMPTEIVASSLIIADLWRREVRTSDAVEDAEMAEEDK